MKKKIMNIQIEFFKNQKPEDIENTLRYLSKKNKFPKFHRLLIMVHYKNLKQRNYQEEFPLMVDVNDIKAKKVEG